MIMNDNTNNIKIAVVIPMYRVKDNICKVVSLIDDSVWKIYAVDDACPDKSGDYLESICSDSRLTILRHAFNKGVGGAMITGYMAAIKDGAQIIVKIDGDGQMNPKILHRFTRPIICGVADYTKGNRFYDLSTVLRMPRIRLFGNAILSFFNKASSGYWNIFDPTNGYTAISAVVAKHISLESVNNRYFFESDMLYHLNITRAVVIDIPMDAVYGDEVSSLKIRNIIVPFIFSHLKNVAKRVFIEYYIRDFSLASIELPLGVVMFFSGVSYGAINWIKSSSHGIATPTGTIMLSAVLLLLGVQFIMAFVSFDISSVPTQNVAQRLSDRLD
jgi:glycosyltransferase involved in cell wall biosynthesis